MKLETHMILQAPMITEESQIQSTKGPQYTFRVNPKANKQQIREAIEEVYPEVKVVRVNTMNYKGKYGTRTGRFVPGKKPNWKKAIVTLREGDSINLI